MRAAMKALAPLCLGLAMSMAAPPSAFGQQVFEDDLQVGAHSPEAWAMSYVTSSTLLTGLGGPPELAPGAWMLGAELASIPRLDGAQQSVGFGGEKAEDLNKSPVFGRLRAWFGLPAGLVGEVAYTPDLDVGDVRAKRLFALGAGRSFELGSGWRASARAFLQRGRVQGDITCPAGIAGSTDFTVNPFGCAAPSSDEISLRYTGAELGAAWQVAPQALRYHLGAGVARLAPEVQVDAPLMPDARDRSRLHARRYVRFFAAGIGQDRQDGIGWSAELLYVPLEVQRDPAASRENDPYWSVRLMLRWRPSALQ